MVVSGNSVAVGAIMHWAASFQKLWTPSPLMGLILMLAGTPGIVASAMVFSWSLSSDNLHHTLDRQVTDIRCGFRSAHHEIKRLTLRVLPSATTRPPRTNPPARGRVTRYQSIDSSVSEVV